LFKPPKRGQIVELKKKKTRGLERRSTGWEIGRFEKNFLANFLLSAVED